LCLPLFTVDAFTARQFGGNPAAVVLLDTESVVSDATRQNIAKEMSLSETAFLFPKLDQGENVFSLRWFTPHSEIALCGHATLGTAHILFNEVGIPADVLHFDTLSGRLSVSRGPASDGRRKLEMDFPLREVAPLGFSDQLLSQLLTSLRIPPSSVVGTGRAVKSRNIVVEVSSAELLCNLRPDFASLTALDFGGDDPIGVVVTSKGGEGRLAGFDFGSRYFAPWVSVPEDPVTGSTHTELAGYWSAKLNNKKSMRAFQASPRGGEVDVDLQENGRVLLSGYALTVLRGTIAID